MISDEMTIADILKDPLIGQLMRADGVSVEQMERLLLKAARAQRRFGKRPTRVGMTTSAERPRNQRRLLYAFPDGKLPHWNPDKT